MKEKIAALAKLSDRHFGHYLFTHDPINEKVDLELREEIIEKSLLCGKELAQKLKKEYGFKNLAEYLKVLDIELARKDTNSGLEYIYFGTYQKPNKITIYLENLKKGESLIKDWKIELFGNTKLEDIVIAHEMFHHLQEQDKTLYINTNKITLWSIGKFDYKSKLVAQAEIASMAFAKEMLSLNFSPNILDVLLLYPHDKELAQNIYDDIIKVLLDK